MSVTYMVQVVMIEPVFERFKQWADSQGWDLFLIPVESDDLPTYAISPRSLRRNQPSLPIHRTEAGCRELSAERREACAERDAAREPLWYCGCDGCGCCKGHEAECTCDVDW